jgi:hypothetical protein
MQPPHPQNNQHPRDSSERLSDILTRVGKRFGETNTRTQPAASHIPISEPHSDDQQNLPLAVPTGSLPILPEYIRAEAFLEISGFFSPSSKRIEHIFTKEKKIKEYVDQQGKRRILKTKISANYELGLPVTSDLDYYRAFLKICDEIVDRNGRFQMPVAVPTTKLIHYAGKKESAREWKEVRTWLKRMTLTGIEGAVYRHKKRDYDDGFVGTVFSQAVTKGETLKNGKTADTNYVWLSPWFLSNYYYRYTRPLDFAFYKQLRKPIAKSLYTLLENGWYATEGKPYAKSYRAICDEFLLTFHPHFSLVKQQLDPSHVELQKLGFLDSWQYHRTTKGDDYIITWYAGQKFFIDQQAKDTRHERAVHIEKAIPELPSPPQLTLVDKNKLLLSDIITTCGDPQNERAYRKVVVSYSESLIREALSETNQAHQEGRIRKTRGAYFHDTLKRLVQYREQRGMV